MQDREFGSVCKMFSDTRDNAEMLYLFFMYALSSDVTMCVKFTAV